MGRPRQRRRVRCGARYRLNGLVQANRQPRPPSTATLAPVTNDARGEARTTIMLATSSGSAILPSACLAAIARSAASLSPVASSRSATSRVRVYPGETALTRIPNGPFLECERFRQAENTCLGSGVRKGAGLRQGRLDGSHVDNRSAAAFAHAWKHGARTQPHRAQVDGEERLPVVHRHRNRIEGSVHAGVVDEHIHRAELGLDRGERLLDLIGRADIAPLHDGRAGRVLRVEVEGSDACPSLAERADGRGADTAGAARDRDHAPAEPLLVQDLRL